MKRKPAKNPAPPKGVVRIEGRWDQYSRFVVFPYETVRDRVVHLRYTVPFETHALHGARSAVGRTVEGWLNHGAKRITVEEVTSVDELVGAIRKGVARSQRRKP